MKGILILAHGSRQKETEETLQSIVSILRAELEIDNIETAFLQFSDKNLDKGLTLLVQKGVTDIKIVPYFLFEGVHIKEDIPNEIEEFKKNHTDIDIQLGKTLGADKRLALILKDRVLEMM